MIKNSKRFYSTPRPWRDKQDEEVLDHQPVIAKPLEVKVIDGQFEKAFRYFRALVQKERVLAIYRQKSSYEKPSVKRRRKLNESKRKQLELQVKTLAPGRRRKRKKNKNMGEGAE